MGYTFKPLYPPKPDCRYDRFDACDCGDRENWRMPLFGCEPYHPGQDSCGCSQTVTLTNPCCPGECAEVELSVDNCGNLVICVHRNPWNRRPKRHR